jgi:hypothetical protein
MVALPLASYNFVVMESFRGLSNATIIIQCPMTAVLPYVNYNTVEMESFKIHSNVTTETQTVLMETHALQTAR